MVYRMFLGWVDRLAGMAMGLTASFLIAGAVMVGMAGFSHSLALPKDGFAGGLLENAPQAYQIEESIRESIQGAIGESSLVSTFLNVTRAIPESALDLVPGEFRMALAELEDRLPIKD